MIPLLVLLASAAGPAPLIEADRAFARASVENGMMVAFLEHLAERAVVFRPRPVDGRKFYAQGEPSDAVLSWGPAFAEIARSEDFGYTGGPFELRPKPGAEPAGFGHYLSVWKKQPDGKWRVVADGGVPHKQRVPVPAKVALPKHRGQSRENAISAELLAMDGDYGVLHLADDVWVYRAGAPPSQGKAPLKNAAQVQSRTEGADIAASGDLGYTYGMAESEGGRLSTYLRIWRRMGGRWRVAADLALEVAGGR
jgi:ketosteroid isomerase-like protein